MIFTPISLIAKQYESLKPKNVLNISEILFLSDIKTASWVIFNIKMLSCHHGDSYYKENTVSQPSDLSNGNSHIKKYDLYTEPAPWGLSQ